MKYEKYDDCLKDLLHAVQDLLFARALAERFAAEAPAAKEEHEATMRRLVEARWAFDDAKAAAANALMADDGGVMTALLTARNAFDLVAQAERDEAQARDVVDSTTRARENTRRSAEEVEAKFHIVLKALQAFH